jgi:hypothetical protein
MHIHHAPGAFKLVLAWLALLPAIAAVISFLVLVVRAAVRDGDPTALYLLVMIVLAAMTIAACWGLHVLFGG